MGSSKKHPRYLERAVPVEEFASGPILEAVQAMLPKDGINRVTVTRNWAATPHSDYDWAYDPSWCAAEDAMALRPPRQCEPPLEPPQLPPLLAWLTRLTGAWCQPA